MVDEIPAIVGGCVGGGAVFFLIVGIIVYQICCKRKHRKKREQNKFRPMTPHTSPTNSQPSTLHSDGRLPKVNSTGLWVGAPSMYTGVAPSSAYYYGPGKMVPKQAPPHPGMIPRASSETRIPNGVPVIVQPRIFHSSQPLAPVFEIPHASNASPGMEIYDVYQFGGGGQNRSKLVEAKHSKFFYDEAVKPNHKLARSQSDVMEKSKLKALSRSRDSSTNSKVNRSSSSSRDNNVQQRQAPAPIPPSSSTPKQQPHHQHSRSNSREMRMAASNPAYRIGMKSRSLDALDDNASHSSLGGHYNKAFDASGLGRVSSMSGDIILRPAPIPPKVAVVAAAPFIHTSTLPYNNLPNGVSGKSPRIYSSNKDISNTEVPHSSATDSMKLLAKNKTDDQKTVGKPAPVIIPSSNDKDIDVKIVDEKEIDHFSYQGDIYAVSGKQTIDDSEENPILSRMKEMVVEKSRTNSTKSISNSRNREESNNELNSSDIIPRSFATGGESDYQEIITIATTEKSVNDNDMALVIADVELGDTQNDVFNVHPPGESNKSNNINGIDLILDTPDGKVSNPEVHPLQSYSGTNSVPVKNDGIDLDPLSVPSSPVELREHTSIQDSPTSPADTTYEEINNAGKRITDSAFDFLNTYLSDEEGGEGPVSP